MNSLDISNENLMTQEPKNWKPIEEHIKNFFCAVVCTVILLTVLGTVQQYLVDFIARR